jgi:hypothetical protein
MLAETLRPEIRRQGARGQDVSSESSKLNKRRCPEEGREIRGNGAGQCKERQWWRVGRQGEWYDGRVRTRRKAKKIVLTTGYGGL